MWVKKLLETLELELDSFYICLSIKIYCRPPRTRWEATFIMDGSWICSTRRGGYRIALFLNDQFWTSQSTPVLTNSALVTELLALESALLLGLTLNLREGDFWSDSQTVVDICKGRIKADFDYLRIAQNCFKVNRKLVHKAHVLARRMMKVFLGNLSRFGRISWNFHIFTLRRDELSIIVQFTAILASTTSLLVEMMSAKTALNGGSCRSPFCQSYTAVPMGRHFCPLIF